TLINAAPSVFNIKSFIVSRNASRPIQSSPVIESLKRCILLAAKPSIKYSIISQITPTDNEKQKTNKATKPGLNLNSKSLDLFKIFKSEKPTTPINEPLNKCKAESHHGT